MLKVSNVVKAVIVAAVAALFALALTGCQESKVAATVNGTEIPEEKVDQYVNNIRTNYGYSSDEEWANYLINMNSTPEEFRNEVIDMLVSQELIKQQADKYGVAADASAVDVHIAAMKANFGDDATWQKALKDMKTTEEKYRESIEQSIASDNFSMYFESTAEAGDDDVLDIAKSYASYYDGSKQVAHILFDFDDEATAKDVLAKINGGEMTFEDAVTQYSTDKVTKDNGGIIGWTRIDTFPTEISNAIVTMTKGDVSLDIVKTVYGIHILKIVDQYSAPVDADGKPAIIDSLDALPAELADLFTVRAQKTVASEQYSNWLDQVKREADIVKNAIPEKTKYNIDLEPYRQALEAEQAAQQAAQQASTTGGTTATTTDGTTYAIEGADGSTVTLDGSSTATTTSQDTTTSSSGTTTQ